MLQRSITILVFILCLGVTSLAQNQPAETSQPADSSIDEKSQQIINRAIEVLGGQAYLNVKTVTGKGFFSAFADGMPQTPSRFVDYLQYPDRERTEFTSMGIKTIQGNSGNTGWLFDGAVKKISDQTEAQVVDFKRAMQTSVENLLRGWWKKEGASVKYVGRREAGLAKRNETVRLTYPNGYWIEYEFGARDGLPAKILYKRTRTNPDTGDVVETSEEDQLLKPIAVDGVTAPWVVDHYIDGHQTSRINYENIVYNQVLPDTLFAKPDNVKAIK